MCKHFTKYIAISIVTIFFSVSIIQAQVDTLWTKTFGGSYHDEGYSVQQTLDGGFIITGRTTSFGAGGDVWLIKTDVDGDTLWTKTFGRSGADWGYAVQQTGDEGYIISGYTSSFGVGNYDLWLIKTNSSGDTLWTKTFGGSGNDQGHSILQTLDEGYIITGMTNSFGNGEWDIWLIKTNASGDTLWTKTFGRSNSYVGYSVQQTIDGGYIITGYNGCLIKTNASGDTLWTKTFGGIDLDIGYSIQQTKDEGYIIAGMTISVHGLSGDVWLVKTDTYGDTLWTKKYGGSGEDRGYSVLQTEDEGYIICGYTTSFGAGDSDVWLIKTNSSGDTLWTKTFGGGVSDEGRSFQQTKDEGFIITGLTYTFGAGNSDVWLIKTTPDINTIKKNNINIPNYFNLSQNFPNPFNPKTIFLYNISESDQVTISIHTISGQLIESKTMNLNPGLYSYEFDGIKYSSGIYLYKISTSSGFSAGRKMVLLK